jgi:hypothetical protein
VVVSDENAYDLPANNQAQKPQSKKSHHTIGGPRVMQLFIEMYSVFVVSAATPRHLPIVWGKNTENITIAKIFKATTYLTSNRG